MTHRFAPEILREYDIRGRIGDGLDAADAHALGRSFSTVVRREGGSRVAVGRDGRLSSPMLEDALVRGLTEGGVHVLRIGLGPTPMLYFAEQTLDVDGAVQVTGSHNPGDQNGFKLVHQHRPFFGDAIKRLAVLAQAGDWTHGAGRIDDVPVIDRYVARLVQGFDGAAFRIGWDAGNGAAGPVLEKLAQLIPGEHHLLFTAVDGNFPHHHPDPTEEANLADLRALVLSKKLDFGVAFDGDGDRLIAIDGQGRTLWGDHLLAIFAPLVLRDRPGAAIVADIKASQMLFDRIAAHGGRAVMAPTGHSHIKSEMNRIASPLGGEMTGHICFADDYHGYDDGLYAALRLIRAGTLLGCCLTDLRDALPRYINTPDMRIAVPEARKFAIIAEIRARLRAEGIAMETIDGVRVRTADGWWLLRASNTQAALTARAESDSEDGLVRVLARLDSQLEQSGLRRV